MAEPAAKKDDIVVSDGSSKVWVQPPGGPPPPPKAVKFSYKGPIDDGLSSNVFVMGKSAATVGSTATNSTPPAEQDPVILQGTVLTKPDNTAAVSTGSSSVLINGKKAARSGDKGKTWDYGDPPSPGKPKQIENGTVNASSSVFVGD